MNHFSFGHFTNRTLARSLRLSAVGLLSIMLCLLLPLFAPAAHAQTTTSGTVVAWGDNAYGQTSMPVGLKNITAVAAGEFHSLALKNDGIVVAWGRNDYGQATVPSGLSNVIAIAAGGSHSLALKNDGTVVAWGQNDYGQSTVPAGLNTVTAIAAGRGHSLALKRDGTVVTWGYNVNGISTVPSGLSNVIAIAAGSYHNLALKNDGTVVAWGANTYAQTNVPSGLNTVTALAAGYSHSMVLKNDGTVVVWTNSQLGQTNVPSGLKTVTAIAAGVYHNLALKRDGTVVAWGYNDYGQGNVPAGLNNVTAIAAGWHHSLAVQGDAVPPDTTITAQPTTPTTQTTATFRYTGSDSGSGVARYECKLDNGTFATCSGSSTYDFLNGGSHTFQVRAIDKAGNIDPTPASFTWLVATVKPTLSVRFTPNGQNGYFVANPALGSVSVQGQVSITGITCVGATVSELKGIGTTSASATVRVTAEGSNTISCSATDSAGQTGWAPTAYVSVDSIAPDTRIGSDSSYPSTSTDVTLSFGSNEGPSTTYFCSLDGSPFTACQSAKVYTKLSLGAHTFQVYAKDYAGNVDPSPASVTWQILENTPPTTTFTITPSAPNANGWYNRDVTVAIAAQDNPGGSGVAETHCVLNPASYPSFASMPSGCAFSGTGATLSEGANLVYAASIDKVGNQEQVQRSPTIRIDKTAPTVTGDVSQTSPSASATVTLNAVDTLSKIAHTDYSMNGGALQTYTAPFTLTVAGTYQISYSTTDNAGNSAPMQSLTITIAALAPQHSPTIDLTSAPSSVVENVWESDQLIRMFPERQNYTLPQDIIMNGTTIAAGTKVNVFYIHADKVGNDNSAPLKLAGSVTFDSTILGVISNGATLTNTHSALGFATTTYSVC